jgi:hypothetical protein
VIQADKTFGKAITKEDLEDLFSFWNLNSTHQYSRP